MLAEQDFLGESDMSGPSQSQPQFMTSVGRSNRSNGPGTPLIESIDVDQIVIPEVVYTFDSPCLILEKNRMSLSQLCHSYIQLYFKPDMPQHRMDVELNISLC